MKVVLDTNVLVSAFLNPFGIPAKILRLILQGDIDIIFDERILQEYEAVLNRPKFKLFTGDVSIILEVLREIGIHSPVYSGAINLPDRGDEPFLEAAITGRVDAVVTGNKRHFPKGNYGSVKVLSPAGFMKILKG